VKLTWRSGVVERGDDLHPRLEDVASVVVPSTSEAAPRVSGTGRRHAGSRG
jgi:hypothetical protein